MKMTSLKRAMLSVAALGGLALTTDVAFAASIGTVANNVKDSLTGVLQLMFAGAYVGGAICGLLAAVKLKAHNDNPQQTPMKTPVVLFIVCAILVALPSFLETSQETVWGSGGGTSSLNKSGGFNAN
jgi:hypothetical protein